MSSALRCRSERIYLRMGPVIVGTRLLTEPTPSHKADRYFRAMAAGKLQAMAICHLARLTYRDTEDRHYSAIWGNRIGFQHPAGL